VEVRRGVYRHYKNQRYSVIDCATHTETGEELVIYRALYGEHRLWARPKQMFLGSVTIDGRAVPRFEYLGDTEKESASDEDSSDTSTVRDNLKP
jgi:hypothetical protein